MVLDPDFGSRLKPLAARLHTWALQSPANMPWIQDVWDHAPTSRQDPLADGITSFTSTVEEAPEDTLVRIVESVDEHHGEYAHDPPWSELEVFGVSLTDRIREELAAYGVTRTERRGGGFCAFRDVETQSMESGSDT